MKIEFVLWSIHRLNYPTKEYMTKYFFQVFAKPDIWRMLKDVFADL